MKSTGNHQTRNPAKGTENDHSTEGSARLPPISLGGAQMSSKEVKSGKPLPPVLVGNGANPPSKEVKSGKPLSSAAAGGGANPPSKEVKSRKPLSSAAAGGGANPPSTQECMHGINCGDMHCEVLDEKHGLGFVRRNVCLWMKMHGHCRICSPRKEEKNNCQFGEKCRYRDTTCKKVHPPKEVDQFPSLGGKTIPPAVPQAVPQAVQAQSENDSAKAVLTFAQMAAATPAVAPTSKNLYGVAEINAMIDQIVLMAKQLGATDQGPPTIWIQLLTQLVNTPNLHELSTQVGQTIAAAESFCKAYTDLILKRDKELQAQKSKTRLDSLLDPLMFEIQTSASASTTACTAYALAWSMIHGQNQEHLRRFAMSFKPSCDLSPEFVVSEFAKSFPFLDETRVDSLKERLMSFPSIQEFRAFIHEVNSMFKNLENDAETFISSKDEADEKEVLEQGDACEEDPRKEHSALGFFIKFLNIKVDLTNIDEETLINLYSQLILSSNSFDSFFKHFEGSFFDVKSSEHFFNMLVRVMTQRLGKDDAEPLKNGLLSGDTSEGFYTAHLLPLFGKSMDRTVRYLQRTDEAVFESMKSFLSMKDNFLTKDLTNFLFSTFETGGNEGRLTVVKAIDTYLTTLKRYFGIVEYPIDVPFGHLWFINYSKTTGEKVHEDVSHLVGDYIFNLVCIAKVLVGKKKDLSIRFGNCGVYSVRGVEKKLTEVSLSFLFDEIGRGLLDDKKFGFVKARKDVSEHVPDVFCPKILARFPNYSRGDIMKTFMDRSIKLMAEQMFESKFEQDSFFRSVEQVNQSFRVDSSEDKCLHLFLSMFKRNANDKFQMSLVEFLLHEPCKVALLDALSFVDPQFQMSDLMKSTVSSVLRFSTNIPESQDMIVISAVIEAFSFIIQSGITLSEVLDICVVFKELYIANATQMTQMVFINTFGVALMTAASKTLGLKFETMYSIVTDCLNPITEIVKKKEYFNPLLRSDVSKLIHPSNNFFRSCVQPPNCESFCRDATSSKVEHERDIAKFAEMAKNLFPLIMFSSIYHKSQKTDEMSLSISEIVDRLSMILIASNRRDVLQMLGLMKIDSLAEQRKKESPEELFLRSVAPSLTTSTLLAYLDSMQRYLQENSKTIQELLGNVELKALKAQFRMETQLQTLYEFLRMSGFLTEENVKVLNHPDVHSTILTTDWRGREVVDIDALSTVLFNVYNVSESFVNGIFSIIHRALYPNHKDVIARRQMMNEIYANKTSLFNENFGQRSCSVLGSASSSSSHMVTFADLAFGSPDLGLKELFSQFMSRVDVSIAKTIQQRLEELPVSLMSNRFLKALLDGTPMNDVECMTVFAKEMLKGSEPSVFVSCFSSFDAYIENVFYDDDNEGVNLQQFREQLSDSSTELSQLFASYVGASIADFESKD
jgi:hypothetical protein